MQQIDQKRFAAVDLGSNTCRTLVGGLGQGSLHILEAYSRVTRLSEGVRKTGVLSENAMNRTLDVLRVSALKLKEHMPVMVYGVATEACRIAKNAPAFLERVREETGIALKIISIAQEARFSMLGCASLLHSHWPYGMVVDIGGASTELLWVKTEKGKLPEIIDFISLPYGVVSLFDTYRDNLEDVYDNLRREIVQALSCFVKTHNIKEQLAQNKVQMVGCSGTVTTISALSQNLACYIRDQVDGSFITMEDVSQVRDRLRAMTLVERERTPCVGQNRGDLVIPGVLILESILTAIPLPKVQVADRGVRDGILIDLATHQKGQIFTFPETLKKVSSL